VEERLLAAAPSLARLYARAAVTARGRGGDLPAVRLRLDGVAVGRDALLRYQHACGFAGSDVLPHTYPHLLGFPLHIALMTDRSFPLALPGLVHLENRITVHRRLSADDRLDLAVHAENLFAHPRGRVVDLVTVVDAGGERVWEGRSTYLRRGPGDPQAAPREEPPPAPAGRPVGVVRVPRGQGRAYAALSGDVNPIHLHPLTARAMGFPRAIAHGMWSVARTLAVLGPGSSGPSTSAVWFGRPLLLPGTVDVRVEERGDDTVATLSPADEQGRPHLTLTLRRLGTGPRPPASAPAGAPAR
jgi:acyl dehydratase